MQDSHSPRYTSDHVQECRSRVTTNKGQVQRTVPDRKKSRDVGDGLQGQRRRDSDKSVHKNQILLDNLNPIEPIEGVPECYSKVPDQKDKGHINAPGSSKLRDASESGQEE